jgi:multiple sugar transport system permease protein
MAQTPTAAAAQVQSEGRSRRRAHNWGRYWFVAPALLFMLVTMVYPVVDNIRMSLFDVNVSTFLANSAPFVGLGNYAKVVADPTFQKALVTTTIFTIGSLVFQFVIGFALALLFNKRFPGNGLLRALLLLGWMLPSVVSGSIFRWSFDGGMGIINYILQSIGMLPGPVYWLNNPTTALAATIIANIWVGIPFNMILLLPGLQSIPQSFYEAAAIDGASERQSFWHVTLPLMRPVIMSVLLLGIIYTFKAFDIVYVMTGGGPVDATTLLTIYVYKLVFSFFRFGEGSAAAILLLLFLSVVAVGYLWLSQREEAAA